MKNFKKLLIWQKGFTIAIRCYDLVAQFPREEKYGLAGQIKEASVSIPCNIAEGSAKKSQKDYHRFLEISLGSCFELETQLLLAENKGFGDINETKSILCELDAEEKMLIAFMNKLSI